MEGGFSQIQSQISYERQMEALLQTHKAAFKEGLCEISTFEATLQLKPTATPRRSSVVVVTSSVNRCGRCFLSL